MLVTQPAMYAKEKGLCGDVTAAIMEGIKYQMLNHEEAAEIFFKAIPEAGMTAGKRKQFGVETDLFTYVQDKPEIVKTGLGSVDMVKYQKMVDLVVNNLGKPGDKKPDLSKILHLDEMVNNKVTFSKAELAKVKELGAPGAKALG